MKGNASYWTDVQGRMSRYKGLTFVMTCSALPEQYDVFSPKYKGKKSSVGYVRLRWGKMRVDCPECGDKTVFSHEFGNQWKGCFSSPEEREEFLTKAAEAILEWEQKERKKK